MALTRDLDEHVRRALAPDTATIERMVCGSLGQRPARTPRRSPVLRAALIAAVTIACAVMSLSRPDRWATGPDDFVQTRAGELVLIESTSGEAWILGPSDPIAADAPARGFIIVEGDEP